jgi:hypothetical protein
MGKTDFIGGRGEAIAYTRLTAVCRKNDLPCFLPHYLGEKCPTFDYLVELVGTGKRRSFFFVQVKATREGYTKTQAPPRLKVQVSARDVRRMALYPAPTYVVGVDEEAERAFVIGLTARMRDPVPSITTAHELNCLTLRRLWDEVRAYWQSHGVVRKRSVFTN